LVPVDVPFTIDREDVLAQSTRARLFRLLAEMKRTAGTAELADYVNLHPNGVRAHLERMEQAGLVVRERVRQPRGRPPDAWTIAPDARPGGEPPHAYQDLGRWLARAIPARPRRLREVEVLGREIGRELAPRDGPSDGAASFQSALVALGFRPRVHLRTAERTALCLENCPYREAANENQPVICTLHRGITRGLLDILHPDAKLTDFVPGDPETAGCLLEFTSVAGSEPAV
jgi:predicted ArsR family transcriptional regulator